MVPFREVEVHHSKPWESEEGRNMARSRHRGKHPEDARLFGPRMLPRLRQATHDLSYLLGQGYADTGALKLVGDHYQLTTRQRRAVLGAACGDQARSRRRLREVKFADLAGRPIALDGYNVLIITESLLSGGVLLRGRDGCIRDLAGLHGSYRRVEETVPALRLIGEVLDAAAPAAVSWYLDAPVSNSGRLAELIRDVATAPGRTWEVQVARSVDQHLAACDAVVATSDGWILDRADAWVNLLAEIVARTNAAAQMIDLGTEDADNR